MMNDYCPPSIGKNQITSSWSQPWMTIYLDKDLNIVEIVNGQTNLIWQCSPEQFMNKQIHELEQVVDEINKKQVIEFIRNIRKAQQEKRNVHFRYSSILPNKESLNVGGNVINGPSGEICCHIMSLEQDDILNLQTEDQERIQESIDLTMNVANITAWIYDIRKKSCKTLYGKNFDTADLFSLVYPGDQAKFQKHVSCVTSNVKSKDTILVRIKREESYLYFESTITAVKNKQGQATHVVGALKDITDSLISQRELRKQKDFATLALKAGNISVWKFDISSQMFTSLEGGTLAGEGLSMTENLRLLHPEDAASFVPRFQSLIEGQVPKLDLKLRYKNPGIQGGYGYYETSIVPILDDAQQIIHIIGTQREFTQEHLRQEELRESKRKTDLAIRTAEAVLWEYDAPSQLFTCYNEPLNGLDDGRLLTPREYMRAFHPEDVEKAKVFLDIMREGKEEAFNFDVRIRYANNSEWQYCTIYASPFANDASGKTVKYVGIRRNNTEMQKQRDLLRTILDNVPIPIQIKDVENDFHYIFWNEESNKLFGEALFKTADAVVCKEQVARIHEIDRQVFDTGVPYLGQEKVTTIDGREYETISRKSIIYDGNKRLLLSVRWDVSTQEELRRKNKILSISMDAIKAFTWYYDSLDDELIFGDGFERTGGDRVALNSMTRFARQIHPGHRERFISLMDDFLQKEEGDFVVEYKIDLANNGNYEWWECRGAMETIHKNGVTYKYVFGLDINIEAHKQIELALLKNRAELGRLNKQNELILNNTNSGLAYVTTNYKVLWENISKCSFLHPLNMYKQGTFCFQSTHGRSAPCESCIMREAFQSKQIEQGEFDLPNGRSVEIIVTPVLGESGDVEGAVLRIDDITERKQMIEDLRAAKMQAEKSDKLKSAFLANMSHEIRTPLNAIVGFSELLMYTSDPAEQEEYKNIISANNELLLKLISDILDLSKIEAGFVELKLSKFDWARYFDEIAFSMQHRVTNPKIQFIKNNPYQSCIIESDKNRLTQILTNYITNAIKYTEKGSIEMGYSYENKAIKLYVKDTGIGIANEKRDKVFQRFEKLDEFAQGTGLGLSICKAITESFGGKVGFDSEAGKGSTFWAIIPCSVQIS